MKKKRTVNVAVMASGSGTNAQNLIEYFQNHPIISIKLVISNKPEAYVLQRARRAQVATEVLSNQMWETQANSVQQVFEQNRIDFVILAGYLRLIPGWLIEKYHHRIINIHPALLPKFGGKGMYGDKVHQAVLANGEKQSGITIHYVDDAYDEGKVIFQATCTVEPGDDPQRLAQKVHALEYKHYPRVAEQVIHDSFEL